MILGDYEKTLVLPNTAKASEVIWWLLKMIFRHGNKPVVTSAYQRLEAIDLASACYDGQAKVIYLPGS